MREEKKVAVVFGGESEEAAVSVKTKESICEALKELNQEYIELEINKELGKNLVENNINLVVNAGHGKFAEDGRLPAMLDIMKIPYTHSNMPASQIGMNKLATKQIAKQVGIKIMKSEIVANQYSVSNNATEIMKAPFVVKPVMGGSSIGVYIVKDAKMFKFGAEHFKYGPVMVEEYMEGREINVAILGNKAIGTVEVKPSREFYDFEAKYMSPDTQYILPPDLPIEVITSLYKSSEQLHRFIGCNNISRVEYLVNGSDAYLLEINTHPGLTHNSLVPKVAANKNIPFSKLVRDLMASARFMP